MEHPSWSNNPVLRNNLMLLADALQFVSRSLRALTQLTVAYKNNSLFRFMPKWVTRAGDWL
jgi:hypothetical protein